MKEPRKTGERCFVKTEKEGKNPADFSGLNEENGL